MCSGKQHCARCNLVPGGVLELGQENTKRHEQAHQDIHMEGTVNSIKRRGKDRLEHTRQNWEKDERWLFNEGTLKMPKPNTFSGKLFRLWKEFKSKMEKRKLANSYEMDRQPMFLNKLFQYKGKSLGETGDRGIDKVCRDLHSVGMRTFAEADSMIKVGETEMNRDRLKSFYGLEISAHRLKKFEVAFEEARRNCKQSIREVRETTPAWWIAEEKVIYTATQDQAKCVVFEVGGGGQADYYHTRCLRKVHDRTCQGQS
ncbi:hypothetical protein SELMODRAFT_404938 [Selaginella moellendorffii]|uniref:Uncharacterized protein n=1 Tax=Selaginella moellendorffii TaxID=88036 RepID=D8QXV2_SELML|nr:hypothetical protein SELMODRAFT_404938 [Selaginella moellendorffii]